MKVTSKVFKIKLTKTITYKRGLALLVCLTSNVFWKTAHLIPTRKHFKKSRIFPLKIFPLKMPPTSFKEWRHSFTKVLVINSQTNIRLMPSWGPSCKNLIPRSEKIRSTLKRRSLICSDTMFSKILMNPSDQTLSLRDLALNTSIFSQSNLLTSVNPFQLLVWSKTTFTRLSWQLSMKANSRVMIFKNWISITCQCYRTICISATLTKCKIGCKA